MVRLAGLVRSLFGVEALVALVAIASLMRMIDLEFAAVWVLPIVILLAAFSLVTGMAWWTLSKGRTAARGWAIAASILSLPLVPVGTAVGIAGICAFWKMGVGAQTPISPPPPSISGDGTNQYAGVVVTVFQAGFLIFGLNWWYHWGQNEGLTLAELWISLLQINLAIFVSALCHELGHMFGGWFTKMSLQSLTVGPVQFERHGGKWNCKFNLAGLLGSGSAAMVPTHLGDLRRGRVIMVAAGPAASLVTAVGATVLALSAKGNAWAPAWEFLSVLATLSWIGVSTLIPVRPSDQYSDGAQIYQLLSNGPWADLHMAFSIVTSSLVTPLRPRDFDAAVLERAAAFMPAGLRGMLLHLYLHMHHIDCGNIPEGLRHFGIAESMYPQVATGLDANLHLDFVYVNAVLKQDAAAARLWWQRMETKGNAREDMDYWKARAALLWTEGSITAAREACRRAESCARELPDAGAYNRDREALAHISAILDCAEVTPPLPLHQVV